MLEMLFKVELEGYFDFFVQFFFWFVFICFGWSSWSWRLQIFNCRKLGRCGVLLCVDLYRDRMSLGYEDM